MVSASAPLPSNPYAYVQQWNFTIQRQLRDGLVLQAGYVGSKGTHIVAFAQQLDQLSTQQLALGSQLLQPVKNPFVGLVTSGPLVGATVPYGQLLRPFPQYNGYNVESSTNRSSIYHSMEVKMEKRFHEAGTVLASYTFSKSIANVDSPDTWLEAGGVGGGIGAVQDTYNVRAERALNSFDARSRLVTSYALDLPIGKGKKLLGGLSGIPNKFVSGWVIDGVNPRTPRHRRQSRRRPQSRLSRPQSPLASPAPNRLDIARTHPMARSPAGSPPAPPLLPETWPHSPPAAAAAQHAPAAPVPVPVP